MKRKLLLFILIIIETLLIISLFFIKLKKDAQLSLHINGRYFETGNSKQIQLKGISTMAFVRYDYNINELVNIFKIFKKYNINLITLYLSPENIYKKIDKLDYLVKWSKYNSIYLYLVPTIDSPDIKFVLKKKDDMMNLGIYLIKRYKNEKNIIYGLWAEPRGMSWDNWEKYYNTYINKAQEIRRNVIIGVSGLDWGRKFLGRFNFDYKYIFLDFHDYPAANPDQLKKTEINKFVWDDYVNKYPILIGEFGGVSIEGFGTEEDNNYFQTVINEANQKKISYVAYTIDSIEEGGGLSLIDWKTKKLTEKGEIFVKSL